VPPRNDKLQSEPNSAERQSSQPLPEDSVVPIRPSTEPCAPRPVPCPGSASGNVDPTCPPALLDPPNNLTPIVLRRTLDVTLEVPPRGNE
jgi:hypothetical protein